MVKKSRTVSRKKPHWIVGIGASAGGLEALRLLFGAIQFPNEMTFIVVQHLAPLHRSRLVELIAHTTKLKVKEAANNEALECGVVYITPPNRDVLLNGRKLQLKKPSMQIGPKPSIDLFFHSLAEHAGECAIGIILSGTGSDGSHGIRAVKAGGGVAIAQTPESSKYDGMPKAAIQTGGVDMELTPEDIAKELARFKGPKKLRARKSASDAAIAEGDPYRGILSTLEKESGNLFSQYKQSTIRRRIDRRITATRSESPEAYGKLLAESRTEAKALFQDVLISVTAFFRDPSAYSALEREMVAQLKQKPPNESYRVWVVGCATGEEAYSIVILLMEVGERLRRPLEIQVFASDLDEQALDIARKGVYSKASLVQLPRKVRTKYFDAYEDRIQIKGNVRDRIVFAKHNVAQDPPFLKLDLVTCRNVLIYFNADLQEKVFKVFHYSLTNSGRLFLGKSENAPVENGFFDVVEKTHRIYGRLSKKGAVPLGLSRSDQRREGRAAIEDRKGEIRSDYFLSMVQNFAPDSVVLDEEFRVRKIYGDGGQFLTHPAGEFTQAMTKLVPSEIGFELTALLHRVQKTGVATKSRPHEFRKQGKKRVVQLGVSPLHAEHGRNYLVHFEPVIDDSKASPHRRNTKLPPDAVIKKLQVELKSTRDHLQTVVEEQETSNEELQSLNEELQSANEELQSTNEEMETANEELQSTNEELTTLNQELNVKSTELQMLNMSLQAVQNAIIYPLLIVDRNLRIATYNPAAKFQFRIEEGDIGQSIKTIDTLAEMDGLLNHAERAVQQGTAFGLQLTTDGRDFEIQFQALRNPKRQVEGLVLSFVDNTEIIRALDESRSMKKRLTDILDHTPAMVTMKDTSGVYIYANPRFCANAGKPSADVIGASDDDLYGESAAKRMREADFEVAKTREPQVTEERISTGDSEKVWAMSKFPLMDAKKRVYAICTIALDVTERFQNQRQLELLKRAVDASNAGILLFAEVEGEFRSVYASDELNSILGLDPKALIDLGLSELLRKSLRNQRGHALKDLVNSMTAKPLSNTQLNLTHPNDEQESWVEIRSSILNFGESSDRHLILTIFDVGQRVRDQKIILQQQDELTKFGRYSALGEIAAGIAHEINTPLNVVTTKTDFLRKLVELDRLDASKVSRTATDIDQMIKNISNIVQGLKSLAMPQAEGFVRTDLRKLISDTLRVCDYRIHRMKIALETRLPAEEVFVDCFPIQITQIIINLINNSADAIQDQDQKEKWITIELRDLGHSAQISVADSGDGIEPELAEKIMSPFFTTKKEKKGTGIGLSLSRTIARRHAGDLILDQNAKNTTFRLEVPKTQRETQ